MAICRQTQKPYLTLHMQAVQVPNIPIMGYGVTLTIGTIMPGPASAIGLLMENGSVIVLKFAVNEASATMIRAGSITITIGHNFMRTLYLQIIFRGIKTIRRQQE